VGSKAAVLIAFRILPGEREGRKRARETEKEGEKGREIAGERVSNYLSSLVPEIENSHVF